MLTLISPLLVIFSLYYINLGSLIRSLILLEFMSFYLLFAFIYIGMHVVLGLYFLLFLFLVFVIEGVIGILLLIAFVNYSVSSQVSILVS